MVRSGKGRKQEEVKDAEEAAAEILNEAPEAADAAVAAPEVQPAAEESTDHRLLRLQADFDNFRKRVARERSELYARANEDLMTEIIPVLDHMEMAISSAAEHGAPKALVEGVGLVSDQLKAVLGKFGLEAVDASGKQFDPNEHEAILHIESATVGENMVIEQTRRGYKLSGRILRPAQVVVSSGGGAAGQSEADAGAVEPEMKG